MKHLLNLLVAVVALFTRAWIEIIHLAICKHRLPVALFTRAWIEIGYA